MEGGLGFKELLAWNKMLLFKLVYDIAAGRSSIWTDWAHCNLVRGNIWLTECKAGSSCVWRASIDARDHVLHQLNQVHPYSERMTKRSGGMDTRVVYDWLAPPGPKQMWCEVIWHEIQPKKWSFLCWMATMDRLQTKARMARWGGVSDDICVLCRKEREDAKHLWHECEVTAGIASRVLGWQGIQIRHVTLRQWWEWFALSRKRHNNVYLCKLLAVMGIIYHVWKLRNDVIFRGGNIDIEGVSREIIKACKFRMMTKLRTNERRGVAMMRRLYQN